MSEEWAPRTKLGRMVQEGEITSIDEIFKLGIPIKEPEIVDTLLPDLKEDLISVDMVQRQTDAGELTSFRVCIVVGNMDGYVGIGIGKGRNFREAIRAALREAKLSIIPVLRGCGAWGCMCNLPHSLRFKAYGKAGSVRVYLLPAPRGSGLVIGESGKKVLMMAGVEDIKSFTKGSKSTRINFAYAVYNALKSQHAFQF
uniref:Small ribosomal subunit protein uS5 n=1 Tax=uncultured korarchaeote TaxID=161241 RepID=A0A1L2JJZ4_9CREN|nr:ribosomal protein S5 [uncultured korarchaeote]